MIDVIVGLFVVAVSVFICVSVFLDLKKADTERKLTHEYQRQFMAAGLAYFVAMTKYVSGCASIESYNFDEEN